MGLGALPDLHAHHVVASRCGPRLPSWLLTHRDRSTLRSQGMAGVEPGLGRPYGGSDVAVRIHRRAGIGGGSSDARQRPRIGAAKFRRHVGPNLQFTMTIKNLLHYNFSDTTSDSRCLCAQDLNLWPLGYDPNARDDPMDLFCFTPVV